MKPKLEYTVVQEDANYGFGTQIRHLIEDGWEPLGGVQVVKDRESGYHNRHYQAMIRRAPWWRFWE